MNIESSPPRTPRGRVVVVAVLAGASLVTAVAATSCATQDSTVVLGGTEDGSPPILGDLDAAPDVSLTQYCASSDCPNGFTTCPTSTFRCDVDLMSDPANCGACGVVCPTGTACNSGRCKLICPVASGTADCNQIVDDGCETDFSRNESCGGCGVKCNADDPNKVCADQDGLANYKCGCSDGKSPCPFPFNPAPVCIDLRPDDLNCGACGHVCDPTLDRNGAVGAVYPHTHYGCAESKCGALKCDDGWGDCDGNYQNGCETFLFGDKNCGACGAVCPANESCAKLLIGFFAAVPGCACPPGQSFCEGGGLVITLPDGGIVPDSPPTGKCLDLTSDPDHCGACDIVCPGVNRSNSTRSCDFGKCSMKCQQGYADCNGDSGDGCETNIDADPSNCGGCGIHCDTVAGQACAGGRCVVKPCDQKDGGPVR